MEYGSQKPRGYRPRFVDEVVARRLEDFGALEICGTRWCGKSWTAAAFAQSVTRVDENARVIADDPLLALTGAAPHVVDEWQDVPAIWNAVRHAVDDSANAPGRYILTGSSTPPDGPSDVRHSGAGRIACVRMRTMTLLESGVAAGGVSLAGLFAGQFAPVKSDMGLAELAEAVCRGGWPALQGASLRRSRTAVEEYLDALFEVSMPKGGKNPVTARRLACSLARNLGTPVTLKTLAADAAAGDDAAVSEATVASYLAEFSRNYFLDELPGWNAPVKAKSRLRTKPKRYLDDPSLAAALLSVGPDRLLEDGQLFGVLFESLCVRDLAVCVQLLEGSTPQSLRYYQDSDGLEVDVVIELADGRWAAVEVKLGESKADDAAANLVRLRNKIARNPAARNPEPAFLAVLVGRGAFARRRKEDGVYVIPIDTLAP
jgi:hypothetical protein